MKRLLMIGFAVVGAALAGCSSDKLPNFTTIQSLRVLAVTASSPELNFDGTTLAPSSVTFTPWIADPYGAGRALTATAYWCVDPGVGAGVTPTCEGNPTRTAVFTDQAVGTSATFLAPNYIGEAAPFNIDFSAAPAPTQALIASAFVSARADQRYNGIALLVFYELTPVSTPADRVQSFRRVLVSDPSKPAKNQNPPAPIVRLDGTEITAFPGFVARLDAYVPASAEENYLFLNTQGTFTPLQERVETTWYLTGPADVPCSVKEECTTDGLFSLTRTRPGELNKFTPPAVALPTTRGRVLVAVARDGRAGNAVKRYCDGSGLCP
jgi:hypothetical protein